jgi:hypothetical protein
MKAMDGSPVVEKPSIGAHWESGKAFRSWEAREGLGAYPGAFWEGCPSNQACKGRAMSRTMHSGTP